MEQDTGEDCLFADVVQDGTTFRMIIQRMPTGWMWLLFKESHLLEKSRSHFVTAEGAREDAIAYWSNQMGTQTVQMNWDRT